MTYRTVKVKVVALGQDADIALLEVPSRFKLKNILPISFSHQIQPYYSHFGITSGIARGEYQDSCFHKRKEDNKGGWLYVVKFLSQEGDSGGPAVSDEGLLCGVMSRGDPEGVLGLFVPIRSALKALPRAIKKRLINEQQYLFPS